MLTVSEFRSGIVADLVASGLLKHDSASENLQIGHTRLTHIITERESGAFDPTSSAHQCGIKFEAAALAADSEAVLIALTQRVEAFVRTAVSAKSTEIEIRHSDSGVAVLMTFELEFILPE